jgi:ubiquinone/menaquinone biosynthesis C-methylase UbiE
MTTIFTEQKYMANARTTKSKINNSWNKYWQDSNDTSAFNNSGASHPGLSGFWTAFFDTSMRDYKKPKVLDIASGNGAVVGCAVLAFEEIKSEITSLDASAAAVENIKARFPSVRGIVADARSMPLEAGSFDIVSSQFGAEYAGHEAVYEAARMVADGGQLVLLLHIKSGSIHFECQQSLDAIKRLRTCQFMPLVAQMFNAAFAVVDGAERTTYEKAVSQLAPAIQELEAIMKQYGNNVASDTIFRLYNDVRHMYQRIQHYNADDVITWLDNIDNEIDAYADRMSSMLLSSINDANFEQLKSALRDLDFSIKSAEKFFLPNNELPLAWLLIAKK